MDRVDCQIEHDRTTRRLLGDEDETPRTPFGVHKDRRRSLQDRAEPSVEQFPQASALLFKRIRDEPFVGTSPERAPIEFGEGVERNRPDRSSGPTRRRHRRGGRKVGDGPLEGESDEDLTAEPMDGLLSEGRLVRTGQPRESDIGPADPGRDRPDQGLEEAECPAPSVGSRIEVDVSEEVALSARVDGEAGRAVARRKPEPGELPGSEVAGRLLGPARGQELPASEQFETQRLGPLEKLIDRGLSGRPGARVGHVRSVAYGRRGTSRLRI